MAKYVPSNSIGWWQNSGHNFQYMLAWIPPWDFLRLAQGPEMFINPQHLDTPFEFSLTMAMHRGSPIGPCLLVLEHPVITQLVGRHTKIIDADPRVRVDDYRHEGRNRASIAIRLGIDMIPCRFEIPYLKNWFQGYQTYDKIWERPDVERKILHYLGITKFKLEAIG